MRCIQPWRWFANFPSTARIPAKPFVAPAGFESLDEDAAARQNEVSDTLSDLTDKQIWHISAPASLDLSNIEQLDIAAVLRGAPVLTSNGIKYGMQPVTERVDLLVPKGDSNVYKSAKTKVSRSFQLRQIADQKSPTLVPDSQPASQTASQSQRKERVVRRQPEGKLNYHYVPFGVMKTTSSVEKENVSIAESILLKASQGASAGAETSTSERREKKKKRKPKLVDQVGA